MVCRHMIDSASHGISWWGTLLSLILVSTIVQCGTQENTASEGEWVSIFNGKDLDGWQPKINGHELNDNYLNTFRVEDGILKVSYDRYEKWDRKFGHIFYREKLSHYRLRLEYRFVGDQVDGGPGWAFRNNGIMLHCQSPESMALDQRFPVSIEAQMLGGNGTDERPTANVCSPGTHLVMNGELITEHCNNSNSQTFHGDQWVTMEVEVHGSGIIRHIVNGDVVMEYEQTQYDPEDPDAQKLITGDNLLISEGYISLQAESHPTEFRNIEVMKLK